MHKDGKWLENGDGFLFYFLINSVDEFRIGRDDFIVRAI
jgi:hypothetical protein